MKNEFSILVDGIPLQYLSFGEGKRPLVIIAGLSLMGLTGMGEAVEAAYSLFARDYRVYIFDRKETLPTNCSTEALADDQAKAMDALGITAADVVGFSQGGMIAQILAAKRPDLVRSLVLGSTMARPDRFAAESLRTWLRYAEAADYRAINRDFFFRVYSGDSVRANIGILESYVQNGSAAACLRFAALASACLRFDGTPYFPKIVCPCFVIGCRGDRVLGCDRSEELAALLGCESFFYGEEYGHAVYDEAPDYKERLLRFLQTVE